MNEYYFINTELHNVPLQQQFETFSNQQEQNHAECIEATLRLVDGYVTHQNPATVILESTPLYANPRLPSQSIDHPSAMQAIYMTDRIQKTITHTPTQHWVMLDDHNYEADKEDQQAITREFLEISRAFPIYKQIDHLARESEFYIQQGDTCSNMDSRFQLRKLVSATQNFEELENWPLLITIHPVDFWGQQRQMIERLIKTVRSEQSLAAYSRDVKRSMVMDSFLHVWTTGNELQVTKPALVNGEIRYIPIHE